MNQCSLDDLIPFLTLREFKWTPVDDPCWEEWQRTFLNAGLTISVESDMRDDRVFVHLLDLDSVTIIAGEGTREDYETTITLLIALCEHRELRTQGFVRTIDPKTIGQKQPASVLEEVPVFQPEGPILCTPAIVSDCVLDSPTSLDSPTGVYESTGQAVSAEDRAIAEQAAQKMLSVREELSAEPFTMSPAEVLAMCSTCQKVLAPHINAATGKPWTAEEFIQAFSQVRRKEQQGGK